MIVRLHKNFKKGYKKLTKSQKAKFKERRNLFMINEFDPVLNNHALSGNYQGYRSINVSGDLRALYKKEQNLIIFVAIGSHSRLYG